MNIVILNGNPYCTNNTFDRYIDSYRIKLHKTGHYVRSFLLREMQINDFNYGNVRQSRGTPDDFRDDFRYISNTLHETDLIVIASPIEHGYVSVLTKMVRDRLAQVLLTYEKAATLSPASYYRMHKLPLMGLILQKERHTSEHELLLNRLSWERLAANLHTLLSFCVTTDRDVAETLQSTFQCMDLQQNTEQAYNQLPGDSFQPE